MAVLVRRRDLAAPQAQPWRPVADVQDLQQQMGQLMEQVLTAAQSDVWVPAVDVEETEDAWILEAEVPGVSRDDIDVEITDQEIAITGEIKERERKGILRRRTRRVGRFEFRVTLPGPTDAEQVDADLNEGVLTVRIPKAAVARSRHIEVREGEGRSNGHAAEQSAPAGQGGSAEQGATA